MSQLWCLDCQKIFDSLQGHNCVQSCVIQGTVNRNNANFQTIVDRQYGTSPITSAITEEENNPFASTNTKSRNANPDFTMRTSRNDLVTNSNDQLNYSNQECASEIMNRDTMLAISEGNLKSNMENKYNDFQMVLGNADHLISNKVGTDTPCNEHSSVYRDLMARNEKPISKIDRKFSKHGQTAQEMVRGENLGDRTHAFAFKATNQRLKATNILAVNITKDAATYTRTLNTQLRWGKNEMEKIPRECLSDTFENKLVFKDKTYVSSQKEIETNETSNPRTFESAPSCSTNDASAVAGPSCSQDMERTCPVCHKKFSNKHNMKMHYYLHSGEKKFTCEICGNVFTQKGSLKIHMFVHTGAKPHTCDICGGCFAKKAGLKLHLLIHAVGKNFKCDICGREFTHRRNLIRHVRTRHKVTLKKLRSHPHE